LEQGDMVEKPMTEGIESVVNRARAGDRQAFAAIYETYFDRIYRYLTLRIGNPVDAEDMTEQVFMKALESINKFEWRGLPFSAWLFRIASNEAVDYFRRRSRQRRAPLDESVLAAPQDPSQEAELVLSLEELIEAMQGLTDLQRQVITLRFGAELPTAQVAQIMDRTPGAVKALQHAALVSLRRALTADHTETGA